GKNAGLIGSFLYAVSPGAVFLDRWVVPTQPTILWSVWFLFVLLSILRGNFQILIPLAILIGLILHIHIAFIPLLLLLSIAYFLSYGEKKLKYSLKTISASLLIIMVLTSPFVLFEVRHSFQQTNSLINAVYKDHDQLTGLGRAAKTLNSGGRSLAGAFVLSNTVIELPPLLTSFLPFLLLSGICYLWNRHVLQKKQAILLLSWFAIVFLGQFLSKRIITEYYFNNLFVILFLIISLILAKMNNMLQKIPIIKIVLVLYLIGVTIWFIARPDDMGGYLYKKRAIEYIKADIVSRRYNCIAVNYIEEQGGGATGFRYLFWLNGLNIITAGSDVPVYSVVEPWSISEKEISAKIGTIGVIEPEIKTIDPLVCNKPERQLLPLWGFNN
ncbi:MAG: hypothetical protein Q7K55_07155, partial [Candidatus Levybacteria bacterium]|nr:hypothetical protein [Candidatus Levybacteria bacterium]